jgi:hypothetical protein
VAYSLFDDASQLRIWQRIKGKFTNGVRVAATEPQRTTTSL